MISFKRIQSSALYAADSNQVEGSWWGIVSNSNKDLPDGPIFLEDALKNAGWAFNFVYVASNPYPGANGNPDDFIENIRVFVNKKLDRRIPRRGALIFLKDGSTKGFSPESIETYLCMYLAHGTVMLYPDEGGVADKKVNLTGVTGADLNVKFQLYNSILTVSEQGDCIEINNFKKKPVATLDGKFAPTIEAPPANSAQLHFAGPARGTFTFALYLDRSRLYEKTNWGFQILIPNATPATRMERDIPPPSVGENNGPPQYVSAWLPFAEKGVAEDVLGFTAQVNLVNPRNQISGAAPTVFFFDGQPTGAPLVSYYRTNYGKKIKLIPVVEQTNGQHPAGLVINAGYQPTTLQNGFRFAPVGDFVLAVDGADAGKPQKILCGLSGTETIAFLPQIDKTQVGTRLRFVSNQPANIPQFPLQGVSPVGPPIDPEASLLDSTYETSWASVVDPARPAHYSAAPKGAELFGKDTSDVPGLLGPEDPGLALPGDGSVVFPLLAVAGFRPGDGSQDMSSAQLELLWRQIIGPTRKTRINSANAKSSPSAYVSLFRAVASAGAADDGLTSATTPTGLITRYKKSDGSWKQLLLSQVQDQSGSVTQQMGFTGLQPELRSAFQTSDQFLVVANNNYLGTPASGAFMPPSLKDDTTTNSFYNRINIGKWEFVVRTGQDNKYGDYRSIMIVKGVKGKIFDIDAAGKVSDDSLVLSPDRWTMKDKFATPNPPDLSELVALSSWLIDYCKDAYSKKENSYFANFVKVIQDENWTGVLILKVAIADIPGELAGIIAGVKDPSDFYAHHIGIEMGQIDGAKVEQTDSTSMFGLIYYADPRFDASLEPPQPVAPGDSSVAYDFSLLTLKALFQNSAIKKFESLAQMVLNQIFGSTVTQMVDVKSDSLQENLYNAVLLEGSVQKNGDAVVYSLASKWPNRYSLANNVLTSVEIDTAQMSTRDDGSKSGQTVSWIGMSGFMSLAIIPAVSADKPQESLPAFDIFSFGPDEGQDHALRQGLNFNNLGLKITTLLKKGGVDPLPPTLELVDSEITFNASGSHAREKSLYKNFQLELLGLVSGNARAEANKSDPSSLGYLPVITQYKLRGVTSGAGGWHGLKFKLNLGTPGALAGKVNLDSTLLAAWADDSGAGATEAGVDFHAMVGIELPGTGSGGDLFSLQTVIKLSIGTIQLLYNEGDKSKKGGFLLVLNEIALKLFGLLKIPPSGNTAFLLFGNPVATDSTGLGWFAMYKQDSSKAVALPAHERAKVSE